MAARAGRAVSPVHAWTSQAKRECQACRQASAQWRMAKREYSLSTRSHQVVVDALLPQSPTGAPLHITTGRGRSPSPAWLPLAVKGYFKALGGYSIPGSNPAPDVYAFTGWIPERLDLNSGFQREKEWNRVSTAWKNGSVIVTLGSGKDAESKGLVKWHAYGVVGKWNTN